MHDRILVPTDGSEITATALERALDIVDEAGEIHVLYVVDLGAVRTIEISVDDIRETLTTQGRGIVDRLADDVRSAGFDAVSVVVEGVPHVEIGAYASDADVDLIVMGAHGRSQRERLLVGSVTERVVQAAEHPVLVVPPQK